MDFPKNADDLNYFTNRSLMNKEGKPTGKLLMVREKGSEKFQIKMTCPECGKEQEQEQEFNKKPYRVTCVECEQKILVEKLSKKKKQKKKA